MGREEGMGKERRGGWGPIETKILPTPPYSYAMFCNDLSPLYSVYLI